MRERRTYGSVRGARSETRVPTATQPSMKVVEISRTGGIEVLELVERPTPQPGAGEVLVRAHAIGVSYFDLLIRTGRYRWMKPLPFVLGNDMAGRVEAIGPGVERVKVGADGLMTLDAANF